MEIMSTRHTAGPWQLIQGELTADWLIVTDTEGPDRVIATVEPADQYYGEAEANGRVLAAAPKLAELLGNYLALVEDGYLGATEGEPTADLYHAAREIIDRIEGRTA